MDSKKIDISIVIPVYNSESCLDELVSRIDRALLNTRFEIIFVNDYSKDNSWNKIQLLSRKYNFIIGINLRKNFGQDNAIMAGLNNAVGEYIIIMDDDLQHEPENIYLLIDKVKKNFDVCYALFSEKKQTLLKNIGSWFNGKVANIVIKKPHEIYLSPFKAIKKEVVREIIKYDGPYPYVDGLLFRVTQNITQVEVEHAPRFSGKGNYNLKRSIRVWLKLATNFSVYPLRISIITGFVLSFLGIAGASYYIVLYLVGVRAPEGWYSLMIVLLIISGFQLISVGFIGEYVGRMFMLENKSPQYVISGFVNTKQKDENNE